MYHGCKISHNSSFNKVENITKKQKRINLAKIQCIIMESEGIKSCNQVPINIIWHEFRSTIMQETHQKDTQKYTNM